MTTMTMNENEKMLVKILKDRVYEEAFKTIPHRFLDDFDYLLDIDMKDVLDVSFIFDTSSAFSEDEKLQKLVDEIFDLFEKKINVTIHETTIPKRLHQKVYQVIDTLNTNGVIKISELQKTIKYKLQKQKEDEECYFDYLTTYEEQNDY